MWPDRCVNDGTGETGIHCLSDHAAIEAPGARVQIQITPWSYGSKSVASEIGCEYVWGMDTGGVSAGDSVSLLSANAGVKGRARTGSEGSADASDVARIGETEKKAMSVYPHGLKLTSAGASKSHGAWRSAAKSGPRVGGCRCVATGSSTAHPTRSLGTTTTHAAPSCTAPYATRFCRDHATGLSRAIEPSKHACTHAFRRLLRPASASIAHGPPRHDARQRKTRCGRGLFMSRDTTRRHERGGARGVGRRRLAMTTSTRNAAAAIRRLTIEYKQLTTDPNTLFPAVGPISEDNYLEWEALLPGPDDTPFEGGVFSARLSFPPTYPLEPPTMRFDPPIFHPNGTSMHLTRQCTLMASCALAFCMPLAMTRTVRGMALTAVYESSAERWSPVQSIEKILLSVLSMLSEPNIESGANIDASKMYRDDRAKYEETIRKQVREQLGL